MARTITFDFRRGGGSAAEYLFGDLTLTPTSYHEVGNSVVLPEGTKVGLINGQASLTNVEPSPSGVSPAWVYRVTVTPRTSTKAWSFMVGVPEGTSPIQFKDLPKYTVPGTGVQVVTGAAGASAYQIAVNNGFVGTEAEWVTAIEGPQTTDVKLNAVLSDAVSLSNAKLNQRYRRDISVVEYGAGQGGANDAPLFQAAVNAAIAAGVGVFAPALNYTFAGTVSLSAATKAFRVNIQKGALITQTVDAPAFEAVGTLGSWTSLTANATAGNRTLGVASTTGYNPGDWIALASSNTALNGGDKIGWLRRIVGTTATVITFDASLPRTLNTAQGAHIQSTTFVPPIELVGGGQIRHADSSNFKTLVNLALVKYPKVGLELGPSGGPGVTFSHCLGGGTNEDFYVHDLVDDEGGGHFGYGINMAGMSRDMRLRGLGERCRHAFTTNVGPNLPNSNQYGEPENIIVDMETRDCSNKALDTHRPGWGIIFIPNHSGGSGGGVQIRSDNTHVKGGIISGPNSVGVAVASVVAVPPTISNVSISRVAGAGGVGILCEGPAYISSPYIYGFSGDGIKVTADGCVINNPIINGVTAGVLRGIDIQANNTIVTFGLLNNLGTGIRETSGKTGNSYGTVAFGSGVTTPTAIV